MIIVLPWHSIVGGAPSYSLQDPLPSDTPIVRHLKVCKVLRLRVASPGDSFTERLRKQDGIFKAALEKKAAETGIDEYREVDLADEALSKFIDAQDRLQASH